MSTASLTKSAARRLAGRDAPEPITVPAPYVLSLVLLDPNQNPLSGASVEAYAFSSGVALNIGQAVADANGHFTMMLTTAFPTN